MSALGDVYDIVKHKDGWLHCCKGRVQKIEKFDKECIPISKTVTFCSVVTVPDKVIVAYERNGKEHHLSLTQPKHTFGQLIVQTEMIDLNLPNQRSDTRELKFFDCDGQELSDKRWTVVSGCRWRHTALGVYRQRSCSI